jgi:hypothetical protein
LIGSAFADEGLVAARAMGKDDQRTERVAALDVAQPAKGVDEAEDDDHGRSAFLSQGVDVQLNRGIASEERSIFQFFDMQLRRAPVATVVMTTRVSFGTRGDLNHGTGEPREAAEHARLLDAKI